MNTTQNNEERDAIILNGGRFEEVSFTGSPQKERVLVKLLSSRKSVELYAIEQEEKQIEFVTGKDAEWVDRLTPNSHARILEVMHDLNFTVFDDRVKRGMKDGTRVVEAVRPFAALVAKVAGSSPGTSTPPSDSAGASTKPSTPQSP